MGNDGMAVLPGRGYTAPRVLWVSMEMGSALFSILAYLHVFRGYLGCRAEVSLKSIKWWV